MRLSRTTRRITAPLASAVALAAIGVAMPASAQAATGIGRCTGQDGVVERSVSLTKNSFAVTHLKTVNLGPGVKYSKSVTVGHETTLSAAASGDLEASGGIHWKLVDLGAKTHINVALTVSHTATGSETESFEVPARSHTTKWVFYLGRRDVRGNWYQLTCSRAPGHGTEYRGAATTYGSEAEGAIICDHSMYKSGSESYIASRAAGC
ncbi:MULTISPECIES: hypothetical protein [unclassified Allobranchiibius]|uniref:hypothetical protein n=1 Tax=unclassified Allobranchiibius TaxID=2649857 RepID=UPI001AA12964|nr:MULTISPECIES: hypothetical protein [unclassified Allobranchiibius]MBO1766465.1 hypothetical protein [Allobranchiibius sp. GilTou38]UIJ33939.1 hypothetical protein LVQ62_12415 [Allobranchiibius sp. GilTou73]